MKLMFSISKVPAITKRVTNFLFVGIVAAGFFLPGYFYHEKKGEAMYKEKNERSSNMIPSIDAAAPAKTETATFALG